MKYRQGITILLVILLILSFSVEGWPFTEGKRILLINSYHQRMPWVADIVKGVEDVLQPEKNNFSLYIENMDSKEFHNKDYFEAFLNTLAVKYQNTELDLIFSSDNNAYDFLRKNRDELFPGVPVVFCGVNNFDQKHLQGLHGFTGVVEVFSALETIELAFLLQPDITRVYVINDYLKTGRLWAKDIETSLTQLASDKNLTIEHAEDLTIEELLDKVAGFGKETVILLGAYFSDRNRLPFRYEQIAKLLSESSSVPIYSLVEFVIDEGLVGGHVISGYYQGYAMAQVGLNILIGTDPQVLPILMEGSNKPIINYEQLKRYGLAQTKLPANITIVNKPFSFYEQYKIEIWSFISFITVLLIAILALVLNTVRLRRAEAALRDSESQFRQLANATWEGLAIHKDGVLLQVNELFVDMFGYKQEELIGEDFLTYIFTDRSGYVAKDRYAGNDLTPYEAEGKRKDGSVFPIEVRVRNIKYGGMDVRVAAIRDISERREMEEQLAQSQKIEAIGTLAGGIAHDFNNILSAIIGYSELILLKHSKDSRTYTDVNKILQAGNRAKALTQQILTFANKSERKEEPVQLGLVINEAMKLLRPSMPNSIEIHTLLNSDSFILGDPTKMHQVVVNLCTNAGKAMAGGGRLTVSVQDVYLGEVAVSRYPDVTEGPFVNLTVEDTGIGIPDEIRSRIFDPFFTTRKKEDGTGLGLSVVHGIVKETGGFISVHSHAEGGRGSRFEVYFPKLLSPESNVHQEKKQLYLGTETIMLVDDETDLIEVGREALQSLGYNVEGYVDSLEAVEVFRRNPETFDLVITDMTMPKMGGDEFAAELLKIREDIPIIVCTGYSETFSEEEAASMGIRKFLFKPVDIVTLTRSVREALD